MAEPKYNIAKDMEGLPTGGRGYSQRYDALRAAAKSRRDLFSGSGRKNLHKLGIKEGYSFVGGEGKTLVDTIEYRGGAYNEGGILNIYKDAAPMETGGGDDDGGDDDGGGNDGTTGPVDPIGPVTGGDGGEVGSGSSGPSLSDLIDAISNMSAPTINIPAPPVYEPPPPPASFAAVGHAATANPGVRIRRSRSRSQGTNTLGTNFFNRGTRNTLRISGLNV